MASDESIDVPSPANLLGDMLEGFQKTQALYVAAKLSIVDVLHDGPKTSHELAVAVGAHEPSLRRLLGYLTLHSILTMDDQGRFVATPTGELLASDHPESERPWAILLGSPVIWHPWGELYSAIVTGNPAFNRSFGESFFDYLAHSQEDAEAFNAAMTSDSSSNLREVLDAYDFSTANTIIDVGGGRGALLRAILERSPSATGIVFDLPSVITDAPGINDPMEANRCAFVGGDMFQSVPAGGDLYILKRIVHDWGDAEAIQILRNCRKAMSDQGKLVLIERIAQPVATGDPASSTDLMMLVLVTGRERTEQDFVELYDAAGFRLTRVIPTQNRSIIEGVPI